MQFVLWGEVRYRYRCKNHTIAVEAKMGDGENGGESIQTCNAAATHIHKHKRENTPDQVFNV